MKVESVPERPYATLSAAQLELRIAANKAAQTEASKHKNAAARKVLARLKSECAELVEERNARDDMRSLPW